MLLRRPGTGRPPQWVSHDGFHSVDDTCPRTAGHGVVGVPFVPAHLSGVARGVVLHGLKSLTPPIGFLEPRKFFATPSTSLPPHFHLPPPFTLHLHFPLSLSSLLPPSLSPPFSPYPLPPSPSRPHSLSLLPLPLPLSISPVWHLTIPPTQIPSIPPSYHHPLLLSTHILSIFSLQPPFYPP